MAKVLVEENASDRGGGGAMSETKELGGKGMEEDAKAQPSGADKATVKSKTPENSVGKMNPSAPGETGTTPGSDGR